jgi:hypothetical protein
MSAPGPRAFEWESCLAAARSLGLGDEESKTVAEQLFAALRDLGAVDRSRLAAIEPMPVVSARWGDKE